MNAWAEIDRLEKLLVSGRLTFDEIEQTQRQLCALKGNHFDDYESNYRPRVNIARRADCRRVTRALAPSYVADTIRAHFPTLGIAVDTIVAAMKRKTARSR